MVIDTNCRGYVLVYICHAEKIIATPILLVHYITVEKRESERGRGRENGWVRADKFIRRDCDMGTRIVKFEVRG